MGPVMRRLMTVTVTVMIAALAECGSGGQKARADGGTDGPGNVDSAIDPDAPASFDALGDAGPGADTATGAAAAACHAAIEAQCRRQAFCRGLDMAACVGLVTDRCPDYMPSARGART